MDKIFKAWIPNVSGRLSFSHIGPVNLHKRNRSHNLTHNSGVDLFCVDTRNSSDTTLLLGRTAKKLFDYLLGKQGEYVFLAVGNSDPEFETLKGHVFKFTLRTWNSKITANEEFKSLISNLPHCEDQTESYRASVTHTSTALKDFCGRHGNHYASFSLKRSGELTLTFDEGGYTFGTNFNDVASSMFRFFREICHTHQHHPERNDVILDAYPASTGCSDWRNEALYSMMRYVIMSKRDRSLQSYQSSLGVTAYAETFAKNFFTCEDHADTGRYNFSELRHSLQVGLDKAKWEDQKIPSWIAVASFAFAVVSLMLLIFRTSLWLVQNPPTGMILSINQEQLKSLEWRLVESYLTIYASNPLSTIVSVGLICFLPAFVFRSFIRASPNWWTLEFLRLYLSRFQFGKFDASKLVQVLTLATVFSLGVGLIATGFATVLSGDGIQIVYPLEALEKIWQALNIAQ